MGWEGGACVGGMHLGLGSGMCSDFCDASLGQEATTCFLPHFCCVFIAILAQPLRPSLPTSARAHEWFATSSGAENKPRKSVGLGLSKVCGCVA